MEDTELTNDEIAEEKAPEVIEKLIPPVYSREMKLFGIVIWSDTRQLDEEAFYDRISSRINNDMAKELLILRAQAK
jgi:hypothetical protein